MSRFKNMTNKQINAEIAELEKDKAYLRRLIDLREYRVAFNNYIRGYGTIEEKLEFIANSKEV